MRWNKYEYWRTMNFLIETGLEVLVLFRPK